MESESENLLATLTTLFAHEGAAREVAILANALAELIQTDHDNWNGGMDGFTLYLRLPPEIYTQVFNARAELEASILQMGKPLLYDREYLTAVLIVPQQKTDPKWREKAKAWLAGGGVNNQGRVRSDNIASRDCDGLLFRSQPEINLYRALKSAGVSFAPLPVFIRGGRTYRRIEPDFVIIKDGLVVVVEVDGDTVHRELPAEAHDRTTILEHEGARIIRILASRCETQEAANDYVVAELLPVIEKLKRSQS